MFQFAALFDRPILVRAAGRRPSDDASAARFTEIGVFDQPLSRAVSQRIDARTYCF